MKKVKLGDMITLQRGYDLYQSEIIKGKYPVVSSNSILGYHNEFKCSESVTIGRCGTLGMPQLILEKFWPCSTTLFVKDFKGNDIKYIYYLFLNLNINKVQSGSAVPIINRNHLHKKYIDIETDTRKQKLIANTLFNIDKKIQLNNKINNELEKLAKFLYNYWFVQFDFPDENGRPYKSSGGEMVYNEELQREIPKGWEVKKLKELVNVITGKEDVNFSSLDGLYPFFSCSKNTLKCNQYAFDGYAVLIAGNGDFNVKAYIGKFNAYQRTYVLIPDNAIYHGLIYHNSINMINKFKKSSYGAIVKFIKKADIENVSIVLPHNRYFLKILNIILNAIIEKDKQNHTLISLRDFLLPLLMNGQAVINDE